MLLLFAASRELKRCIRRCERKELAALTKCLEDELKNDCADISTEAVKFQVTLLDLKSNSPVDSQHSVTQTCNPLGTSLNCIFNGAVTEEGKCFEIKHYGAFKKKKKKQQISINVLNVQGSSKYFSKF